MSDYQFVPETSFVARLFWSEGDGSAQQGSANLHRVGVLGRPESRLGSDGWLFAGPHDYSAEPVYNITDRLIFPVRFWFGCYETQGRYDFDIRASATDPSSYVYGYRGHRLDISRGGYLGLYGCSDPVGVDPLGAGMMIWRLEGLEAGALESGQFITGLDLVSLHGLPVRQLTEDGFPYLNEKGGASGKLALQIMSAGVPYP